MSAAAARLVFFLTAAFFVAFFLLPIWQTMQVAFVTTDGRFTLEYVWEMFANTLYREGLINSFSMAFWTTLGCLLVSVPLAVLHVKFAYPGKALLNSLVLLPMILPPFVGAIGIRAMLGQAGAVNALLCALGWQDAAHPIDWLGEGQMLGIVVMNVLHLFPILYLNVCAAMANLDPAMEEAAANLGCNAWDRFWRITLPLIMPGIFAGGAITFIWAFTELGVPLVFDYDRVTSVQIFNALKDISNNPFPYAMVAVLLVITTSVYALSKWLWGNAAAAGAGKATTARTEAQLPLPLALSISAAFITITLLAVLPHLGVVLLSVAGDWYHTVLPSGLTLGHFGQALGHEQVLTSITNSLKYASLSTLIDLVLGIGIAYVVVRTRLPGRQILDAMAMLPLAVPGLVLAFGYLALSREGRLFHGLMLGEDPLLLLVIAYSVRRLPYIVRSASAGFEQVSPALEEAAQNLGATPARALWRITLPLVAPNLVAGCLLAFSFAMLEVSDSMILAQQAVHYPITKAIYSLISALGNGPNLASALGVWAMAFLGITIAGASLILGKKLGALFRG